LLGDFFDAWSVRDRNTKASYVELAIQNMAKTEINVENVHPDLFAIFFSHC